jgi:hypothetical protein
VQEDFKARDEAALRPALGYACMHACRSAAARLPDLRKRGNEIGMLDGAESVDVDADADLNVDVNVEVGGGVDLYGDVEIQHSTAHYSTLQHDHPSAFSQIRDTFESTDGRFGREGPGWDGPEMGRCTSSTRPPGSTSISRVYSATTRARGDAMA